MEKQGNQAKWNKFHFNDHFKLKCWTRRVVKVNDKMQLICPDHFKLKWIDLIILFLISFQLFFLMVVSFFDSSNTFHLLLFLYCFNFNFCNFFRWAICFTLSPFGAILFISKYFSSLLYFLPIHLLFSSSILTSLYFLI